MKLHESREPQTFDTAAAAKLPPEILFGTSTWTYPGWRNLVYNKAYKNEKDFRANCLAEYAVFPWFRTVGIDNSFYRPLTPSLLKGYAKQLPPGFKWISKVWEQITIPHFPKHARYGKHGGTDNPDFLNAELFTERVLAPCRAREVREHCGPFVFQFPTIAQGVMPSAKFFDALHAFLSKISADFRYAVEVRNPEYLCPEYFQVLNGQRVTHCFNHWNYMPSLKEQMQAAAEAGGLTADFFVARILTPPHVDYKGAVDRFKPYDQIKEPLPEMRADVVRLAKRAIARQATAFVIVNNRAEGNAPLTIDAIGRNLGKKEGVTP